ncbi:MAG: twin-arginine translocase TatA/TatE family subunit [Chloroflexia bacterium]
MGGNFFGIGLGELLFLAVLALLIFGPRRLPEIGRAVGRFLREVRQATSGLDREVRQWMDLTGEPAAVPTTPGDLLPSPEEKETPPEEKGPPSEIGPAPPERPG